MKPNNIILVTTSDLTLDTYNNCTFTLDNCDSSVRIENRKGTVAHYRPNQWLKVEHRLTHRNA